MYYLEMKTLSRPQTKSTIAISYKHPTRQNKPDSLTFQYVKFQKNFKFLLLGLSFFTFIMNNDIPNQSADICNKYYSSAICNIW
tara:strand:- start:49 stop:300 length:252 start_codon:yes stop_codon:yes gene_type:complete